MHAENGEMVAGEEVQRYGALHSRGFFEKAKLGGIRGGHGGEQNRGHSVPARDASRQPGPHAEHPHGRFGDGEFRGEGGHEGEERHAEDVDVGPQV